MDIREKVAFIVGIPTAQMAHWVFANTQPNAEKTKRAIFCQRLNRKTNRKN